MATSAFATPVTARFGKQETCVANDKPKLRMLPQANMMKSSNFERLFFRRKSSLAMSTRGASKSGAAGRVWCVAAPDTNAEDSAAAAQAFTPFHLAIPVNDIAKSRHFYGEVLGCPEGRSAARWVDFNLYGHQLVCHLVDGYTADASANAVDGDPVPVPHFGLAMTADDFHALAERLKGHGVQFVIEPHLRFQGAPGEQWTMFFKDPSGNSLEFKAMSNPENLFAKYFVTV